MPTLIIPGTFIRFADIRYDDKSKTTYTKINVSADWSERVRETLEWGELPDGFSSAKLNGELSASMMVMTPYNELKHHAFDLEIKEAGGFEVHLVQDGESTKKELRFQLVTPAIKAPQKLAAYLGAIGKGQAQLKITYDAQSKLEEDADKQERLISEEQAADTSAAADGPTLLPVGKRHGARQKNAASDPVN